MKKEKDTKKRFGTIAIEKGYITEEQLREAMDIQIKEDVNKQKRTLIGTILQALEYISLPQIDDVMETISIASICPHCGTRITECPHCGAYI